MNKWRDRILVFIVAVIIACCLIVPKAWSVNVPLNVDLLGAFGRTCDLVVLDIRAGHTTIGSVPFYNVDAINQTVSLGPDTNWTLLLAIKPDATTDSFTTWAFAYNYWFSGGTRQFSTPAYWNFDVDSVRMNYTVNGNTVALRTRTGVRSYDTSFTVAPYQQYVVFYELFEPGSTNSLDWYWSFWADTTGGATGPVTPPAANLCAVTGTVQSTDGTYIPYADVTFELPERVYDSCTGAFLAIRSVSTRTDATGRFTKNLVKSTCLGGTRYEMYVRKGGNTMVERIITVPNASTYTVTFQ